MDLSQIVAQLSAFLTRALGLKTPRYWRRVLVFVGLVVVGNWAVRFVLPLFLPFILALALAASLEPLVRRVARVLPRWAAVLLVLTLTLAGLTALLVLLGEALTREALRFVQTAPRLESEARSLSHLPWVRQLIPTERSLVSQAASFLGGAALHVLSELPLIVFFTFITLLATFLISLNLASVQVSLWSQFTAERQSQLKQVWADVVRVLGGYLKAQFLLGSAAFVVSFLWLLPYPTSYRLGLALLLALLNFIPFFGPGLALGPWAWYLFVHNQADLGLGALLLAVFLGFGRQLVEPRLLQQTFRVQLLPLLIAIFAGERLWGSVGVIVGPLLLVLFESLQAAGMI